MLCSAAASGLCMRPHARTSILRLKSLLPLPGDPAIGVGHPAIAASADNAPPAWFGPPLLPSVARGVFQVANWQIWLSDTVAFVPFERRPVGLQSLAICPPSPLLFVGVGQPVESVADVRSPDARRRKRDRPEGVTQGFHVSLYKVDPYISVFAANLLTKDDDRVSLSNEMEPCGP